MADLRSAYRGVFKTEYNVSTPTSRCRLTHKSLKEWAAGVVKPRRRDDEARDKQILHQVQRWSGVEGDRPRLRPEEWALGMVKAMKGVSGDADRQ
jgi:hypothetical protein